jgi:diamine N-acetyltransferase
MQLVLKEFLENERIQTVGISYEPENKVAQNLYATLGFLEPGEMLDGETLAVLKLR